MPKSSKTHDFCLFHKSKQNHNLPWQKMARRRNPKRMQPFSIQRHFRVSSPFRAPFWALAQRENLGRHQCRCQANDHQSLGVVFKTAAVWFPDAKCREQKTPEGFPAQIRCTCFITRGFTAQEGALTLLEDSEANITLWCFLCVSFLSFQDILFMTFIMFFGLKDTLQRNLRKSRHSDISSILQQKHHLVEISHPFDLHHVLSYLVASKRSPFGGLSTPILSVIPLRRHRDDGAEIRLSQTDAVSPDRFKRRSGTNLWKKGRWISDRSKTPRNS